MWRTIERADANRYRAGIRDAIHRHQSCPRRLSGRRMRFLNSVEMCMFLKGMLVAVAMWTAEGIGCRLYKCINYC